MGRTFKTKYVIADSEDTEEYYDSEGDAKYLAVNMLEAILDLVEDGEHGDYIQIQLVEED